MDPLLIISPHLDDAVLSNGQLIAGRPDTLVATVFTGCPRYRAAVLTSYDRNCGFVSAVDAVLTRMREDRRAVRSLAGVPLHLGFPDNQYREDDDSDVTAEEIAARLLPIIDGRPRCRLVLGPLGLAHPDHHLASDALRVVLAARPHLEGWVYEDLPSRVLWPEEVPHRLGWWEIMGFRPTRGFLGTGPLEQKEQAVAMYASQLWALNVHEVLVSERHYRLWKEHDGC